MDVDEAIEQMELLGHDFFLFHYSLAKTFPVSSTAASDGSYGLIIPHNRAPIGCKYWLGSVARRSGTSCFFAAMIDASRPGIGVLMLDSVSRSRCGRSAGASRGIRVKRFDFLDRTPPTAGPSVFGYDTDFRSAVLRRFQFIPPRWLRSVAKMRGA